MKSVLKNLKSAVLCGTVRHETAAKPSFLSSLAARSLGGGALAAGLAATTASATVVNYTDKAAWLSAAGSITTIGGPNIPYGDLDYDQLGVTSFGFYGLPIPYELEEIWGAPPGTIGFASVGNSAYFHFSSPYATALAVEFAFVQSVSVTISYGSSYVGQVIWPGLPVGDYTPRFFGLTSTAPFSNLTISNGNGTTISYGTTVMFSQIPAPSGVALLALAPIASRRRRR